MGIISAMASS